MNVKSIMRAGMCASFLAAFPQVVSAEADLAKGRQAYGQCIACHSLEKGAHRTGPSLFGLWNRKAGTAEGFRRFSDAMKTSGLVWNEETLDRWLKDPKGTVPGNRMVFLGIGDDRERRDLIAFLKAAGGATADRAAKPPVMAGMREPKPLYLKGLGDNNQVTSITHCGDTYDIATASGERHKFWEFNVRLKTDTSENGPHPGKPVIIPAGMRGDRISVVFAAPTEISPFIKNAC